jgi:hypothetical protein
MSSDRLSLMGLVATRARLCFTGVLSIKSLPHRLEPIIIEP